jgi:perosamine synthetase
MTTAEGGAVASIHPELLMRAKRFSRQGLVRNQEEFILKSEGAWHQEVHEFGLNYRLPDVLCSLGISQLKRINLFKHKRTEIFLKYLKNLNEVEGLKLPTHKLYTDPNWHLYPIGVEAKSRRKIFDSMRASGIGVQVNYVPAYWHPIFNETRYPRGLCPIAESFYHSQISLPMHFDLKDDELEYVLSTLVGVINK